MMDCGEMRLERTDHSGWCAVFDVDGTLTRERSVWEYLHRSLGKWESEGRVNLESYITGRIDYAEFARLDALAYRGLHRRELEDMVRQIPRRNGIEAVWECLHRHDIPVVLLSTGLTILLEQFSAEMRIANALEFHDDICTGRAIVRLAIDGKPEMFQRLMAANAFRPDRMLVAGDSRGDSAIMAQAGLAVAVDPSHHSVAERAHHVIEDDDLTRMIPWIETWRGMDSD